MSKTFEETQRFNKWWQYLLICSPVLIFSVLTTLVYFDKITTKDGQKHTIAMIAIVVGCILFSLWFLMIHLKTTISSNGIVANFKGIPLAQKNIAWSEIKTIDVVKYSPLMDYGGWGVRWSFNGWCYNVSGKQGIKIILVNEKTFLIGTQKPSEAKEIINQYFTHREHNL